MWEQRTDLLGQTESGWTRFLPIAPPPSFFTVIRTQVLKGQKGVLHPTPLTHLHQTVFSLPSQSPPFMPRCLHSLILVPLLPHPSGLCPQVAPVLL